MDGQRFDAWTRLLARGSSRRGTLITLAGAALAGGATRASVSPVAADDGNQIGDYCDDKHPCNKDKDLVCVLASCEKKKPKCEGNGCNKKGKGKKGKGKKGKGKKDKGKKKHGGGDASGCHATGCQQYLERCMPDGLCVPIECVLDDDCLEGGYCLGTFECYYP